MEDQSVTLDPRIEIPEDAPRAQHHSEEDAQAARERQLEYKETVEAEAEQEEVGARAPGDYAGEEDASDPKASEVPDGTIDEVKEWVGDDPERARQALEAERAGQNRTTLVAYLESF